MKTKAETIKKKPEESLNGPEVCSEVCTKETLRELEVCTEWTEKSLSGS